jgi:hypothetical protein
MMTGVSNKAVDIDHKVVGHFKLYCEGADELLFTENESNFERLYGAANFSPYTKDGINEYIVEGDEKAVNPNNIGTKASAKYEKIVKAGESVTVRLRLVDHSILEPFGGFEDTMENRIREGHQFYNKTSKTQNY